MENIIYLIQDNKIRSQGTLSDIETILHTLTESKDRASVDIFNRIIEDIKKKALPLLEVGSVGLVIKDTDSGIIIASVVLPKKVYTLGEEVDIIAFN